MANYFFDTSAIAKAYRNEVGSAKVVAILTEPGSQFFISSLTVVELLSVFAQKLRTNSITPADFHFVRSKFGGDVRARRLVVKSLFKRHFHEAENLIATHGQLRSLRTLDALQLAIAKEYVANAAVQHFVVADRQLAALARLEGLSVIDPEIP